MRDTYPAGGPVTAVGRFRDGRAGREAAAVRMRGPAGQAMLTVMAVMLLLALIPAVLYANVSQHVPLTLRVQNQKAAAVAAESGVSAYMARLQEDPGYVKYNDVTCKSPSASDPAFFLPTNYCTSVNSATSLLGQYVGGTQAPPLPTISKTDLGSDSEPMYGTWTAVSGSSANLNEGYAYTVDGAQAAVAGSTGSNPATGTMYLIVVGRAGLSPWTQYSTEEVALQNAALSYAFFTNYETTSPYTYASSEWFQLMMDAVNFAKSSGLLPPSMSTIINMLLGNGPTGLIKIGALFCNYHAYDTNPIGQILASGMVQEMLGKSLAGLSSINLFGIPIGQDIVNGILSAVSAVLAPIPTHGPFPIVCNINDLYGTPTGGNTPGYPSLAANPPGSGTDAGSGYYGLKTTIAGKVYTNDALYVCGQPDLTKADVTFGSANKYPSGVSQFQAPSGTKWYPYIYSNLPSVGFSIGPIFGTTYNVTLLAGCNGKAPATAGRHLLNGVVTPPEPDFSQLSAIAAQSGGCQFYGPTFIQLQAGGDMLVWGQTGANASNCSGENSGTAMPLPAAGVIYVHNLPGGDSSCTNFPVGFVLPFSTGSNEGEPLQHHNCAWGDAIVQGTLNGSLTIAADNNIDISGNVIYACAGNGGRTVPYNCPDSLGLAPGGNLPLGEPFQDSSGTYYPEGNVEIVHPVVNGQNDNNCTINPSIPNPVTGSGISWCGIAKTAPTPPDEPSIAGNSIIPPDLSCSITNFANCVYDIFVYIYTIELQGYYCGLGSQVESIIGITGACPLDAGAGSPPSASDWHVSSDSLAMNLYTTNPSANSKKPSPPPVPSCTPPYSIAFAFPIPLDSCSRQWAEYYFSYGTLGGGALLDFCSMLDLSSFCSGLAGYEGNLQTWESTWVHGPSNSFPAVYDPVVDADIVASNSLPNVEMSTYDSAGAATSVPQVIQNGSVAVQNLLSGNEFPYSNTTESSGMVHGLDTATFVGSIIQQYNDGFASAGLLMSHFEFFQGWNSGSAWGCEVACYVPSGFRNVHISYTPAEMFDPAPYLLQQSAGAGASSPTTAWFVATMTQLPSGRVVTGG